MSNNHDIKENDDEMNDFLQEFEKTNDNFQIIDGINNLLGNVGDLGKGIFGLGLKGLSSIKNITGSKSSIIEDKKIKEFKKKIEKK